MLAKQAKRKPRDIAELIAGRLADHEAVESVDIAGPGSLVLLDELGASTDPEEGAALARAVLDRLAECRVPTIVTTHHRSVAAHAEATVGMENASGDLDPDTLAPTYRLTMGIPGRSYAMSVAAGLGMPKDVLAAAGSYIDAKLSLIHISEPTRPY